MQHTRLPDPAVTTLAESPAGAAGSDLQQLAATRPSGSGGAGRRQGRGGLPAALAGVVEKTYFEAAPLGLRRAQVGCLIEESSP